MSESFALFFIILFGGGLLLLLFYSFYLGLKPDKKTERVNLQTEAAIVKVADKPKSKSRRR
jgi:hypothetical protein